MITLELLPKQQALIEKASQQAGMSVEEYIISKILPKTDTETNKPLILSDLVTNRKLHNIIEDPVKTTTSHA